MDKSSCVEDQSPYIYVFYSKPVLMVFLVTVHRSTSSSPARKTRCTRDVLSRTSHHPSLLSLPTQHLVLASILTWRYSTTRHPRLPYRMSCHLRQMYCHLRQMYCHLLPLTFHSPRLTTLRRRPTRRNT